MRKPLGRVLGQEKNNEQPCIHDARIAKLIIVIKCQPERIIGDCRKEIGFPWVMAGFFGAWSWSRHDRSLADHAGGPGPVGLRELAWYAPDRWSSAFCGDGGCHARPSSMSLEAACHPRTSGPSPDWENSTGPGTCRGSETAERESATATISPAPYPCDTGDQRDDRPRP